MDYYVYVFLREDYYSPYYVGKGRGDRCFQNCGRNTKPPKDADRIRKVAQNLSNEEACALVKKLELKKL